MIKRTIYHSLLYFIAPQLPKLIGFLLLPILTQHLTSEDYAVFGITMAYTSGLGSLKELGLTPLFVNYLFRSHPHSNRWKLLWRDMFGLLILWTPIYALILTGVLYWSLHPIVHEQIYELLLLVVTPVVFFDLTYLLIFRLFQSLQKVSLIVLNTLITGIAGVLVNYISIVHLDAHFMGFFWGLFISSFISFLIFFPFLFKYKLYPIFLLKKRIIKRRLAVALPNIPHAYSSYLLNMSDRVVLNIYRVPLSRVGIYNFAYLLGGYVDMVGTAVGMAVGPIYLKAYAKRTKESDLAIRDLTLVLHLVFVSGLWGLSLFMKEIFSILASDATLKQAYPYAIVIVMSYAYRPMYWGIVNRIMFDEHTKILWKISFIGGFVGVFLNILLVPFWGITATTIATFVSFLYTGFSGYILYRKYIKYNYYYIYCLFSIIFLTCFSFILKDFLIYHKILILLLYFAILAIIFFSNKKIIKSKYRDMVVSTEH